MDFDTGSFLGLRPGVGKPIPGLPRGGRKIKQMFMTWLPMTMTRPDGSSYSLFVMYQEERGATASSRSVVSRAAERRRHLAPVRVSRAGSAFPGRQPPVHARNHHVDRHRQDQASVDDHCRRTDGLSSGNGRVLRLERLGVRPVGRRGVGRATTSPTPTNPRTPANCISCGICLCGLTIPSAAVRALGTPRPSRSVRFERGVDAENSFL